MRLDTSGGSAAVTLPCTSRTISPVCRCPALSCGVRRGRPSTLRGPDDPVSGTAQDGIYQIVVDMPQYSAQGTWTILYFEISDRANNVGYFDNEYLTAAGYPSQIFNEPAPSC
jgi:hypothetical protein